jgi:dihydroorotate dehydrogenase (fumarate)
MNPDDVHNRMIKMASMVGRKPLLLRFIKLIFVARRDKRLIQKYHNIEFKTPVGLAAGFDKNGEIIPAINAIGFGFGTVGSVTGRHCDGNPRPWFYRLPKTKSLIVNAGLGNIGSSLIIKRIRNLSKRLINDFPIVLSVAKTNSADVTDDQTSLEDYILSIKRAKNEKNIKLIELNISCPNAFGGEQFTTPERLKMLLIAVDEIKLQKPVLIKMPINLSWADTKALLDVIVKHNVVGVTIGNLAKDRSKADLKDVLPDTVKGNMSGRPTWDLSNELIRKTYLGYGDKIIIIGVGGIFTAEDAYKKIRLGSSLVELISGMIFYGPQLVAEINDGLSRLLKRDGFTHISQAIGVDAKK